MIDILGMTLAVHTWQLRETCPAAHRGGEQITGKVRPQYPTLATVFGESDLGMFFLIRHVPRSQY